MKYTGKYMCYAEKDTGKEPYMKEYHLDEKHRTYTTYWADNGDRITVGIIKECIDLDTMRVLYPVEIWKDQIDRLAEYGEDITDERIIADLDLDYGYRVMHYRLPNIIACRIPSSRRSDIEEVLKEKGMKRYNAFEMLSRCSGIKRYDNFRLTNEPYDCGKNGI